MSIIANTLAQEGFCVVDDFLTQSELVEINTLLLPFAQTHAIRHVFGAVKGLSDKVLIPRIYEFLSGLLPGASCIKSIYFNKPPGANWPIYWHQDCTINVQEKRDLSGWVNWTYKGFWSVQPPADFMARVITLRLHLDHADSENGAIRVIPGSHLLGRLSDQDIDNLRRENVPHIVDVGTAGLMLMHPLLVHSSSRALNNMPRRVIHLEFSIDNLPNNLTYLEHYPTNQ